MPLQLRGENSGDARGPVIDLFAPRYPSQSLLLLPGMRVWKLRNRQKGGASTTPYGRKARNGSVEELRGRLCFFCGKVDNW